MCNMTPAGVEGNTRVEVDEPRASVTSTTSNGSDVSQRSSLGEKEKRRQFGMLQTFARRFQLQIPGLETADVDTMDKEALSGIVRDFLHQYLSGGLKSYVEAGRLSGFRRLKELVQEASAQLDPSTDSSLAAAAARAAALEFPHLGVSAENPSDVHVATALAKAGLTWLADHQLYDELHPVLSDEEASTQLRLKRIVLEVRRTSKADGLPTPSRPAKGAVAGRGGESRPTPSRPARGAGMEGRVGGYARGWAPASAGYVMAPVWAAYGSTGFGHWA
mmetsp:Transcript_26713/g.64343  ORF Transcript_26713/g.64343 Transcript_26713/m.64343 type:complete len:276 (+) Transcript_26713:45-872(+)